MDLNLTLFGEMITFIVFIWVTMKYIWPPVTKALEDRRQKIAEGIEAGEHGKRTLELAKKESVQLISKTRQENTLLIEQANDKSARLVEQAKKESQQKAKQILDAAQLDIIQQVQRAKESLKKDIAHLAVLATEKILEKNVNKETHDKMLDQLIATIAYKNE